MSILLPTTPGPVAATPAYLDWGGLLRPIFGGTTQKLNRLGDRFSLAVDLPPMPSEEMGRIWVAKLIQAQPQGAIFEFPQYTLAIGNPGAPVIDGAGQQGSTIALRGLTPGYRLLTGQFLSIIHGGRRYLEMANADAVATADGKLLLSVAPMLRMSPANGAICEIAQPMIEGHLIGDRREWSLDYAMRVGLSFTIEEAK